MGTRGLIHIKEDGKDSDTLVTVYSQYDAYPSGLGNSIKKILGGKTVVDGYSNPNTQVNGMGCAAAMLIAGLKDGCGAIYIYPADSSDVWEDYTYTLYRDGSRLMLACDDAGFDGPLDDFDGEKLEATAA